jgi:hypothetical protein
MNAQQHLGDDLLLEIGRIAALRGAVRASLLSGIDALLSTGLHDQGFGRLLAGQKQLSEICSALVVVSRVRNVPEDAVNRLIQLEAERRADFELAAAIADGTWTLLSGNEDPQYGLFRGQSAVRKSLEPQWEKMKVADLVELRKRLEIALESIERLIWGVRGAKAKK